VRQDINTKWERKQMKRAVLITTLLASCLPAFAIDNSASAWEFRRQNCTYVAQIAGTERNRALHNLPEQQISEELRDTDPLYTLTVITAHDAYASGMTPDDAARAAFAKCIDNIDRIYQEWQQGVKTDPKYFR
jgi:hypothetical protein